MKVYGILIMILLMVNGIAFAEEGVQIDSEQAVYDEQVVHAEDVPAPEKTKLDEIGDTALKPIAAVKDATNEFVNPGMELVYESGTDNEGDEFTAEGPKFKRTF